jgi:hypothetical protein
MSQQPNEIRRSFFRCEKCGKKLIERLPNGCWRFIFGKTNDRTMFTPVEMKIHGSILMRCLRRKCRRDYPNHWNVLNYFPANRVQTDSEINPQVESSDTVAVIQK